MARMEKNRDVELLTPEGKMLTVRLFFPASPPWYLEFFRSGGEWKVYEGDDLFDCVTAMRGDLEKEGIKLLCNGARKDVFSSKRSRQVDGGVTAYELVPGCRATEDKLVDLFEYAPPAVIASVEEQKHYFQDWLNSVKQK
jgi:hypothetical protein